MSTFYLLPPRAELARRWANHLRQWLPVPHDPGAGLADDLVAITARQPGVYVVFADDLPDGDGVREALRDGFGAEAEDCVIDLRGGPRAAAA
jgi:hypothetical protein